MFKTQNNISADLSYVPAADLEQNLALALDSIGQKMGHQKLKEMAARLQGYPSLNHRAKPAYAYQKLAILLTDLSNESGCKWADLEVDSVIIEITIEDLGKFQQAAAMIAQIDKWGSVALSPGFRVGLRCEVDPVEDLANSSLAQWLEQNDAHRIPLDSDQLHVSASSSLGLWFTACEKDGLPFSSRGIELDKLVKAFQTGSLDDSGWIVVAAE